jgi:hypothetical protein
MGREGAVTDDLELMGRVRVLGIVAIGGALIAGLLFLLVRSFYSPSSSAPPTESQLSALADRFAELRPTLERVLSDAREIHHLWPMRDSLLLSGDTLGSRKVEEEYATRLRALKAGIRPPLPGEDIILTDSLVYLSAWTRRGAGLSAPSRYAGYVFASRPPENPDAWKIIKHRGPMMPRGTAAPAIGRPFPGQYRHLDGDWYLYSIDDPWKEYRD